MGFWDIVGEIAGEAAKSVTDTAKRKKESDHYRKMAIAYVLKQRGYGNNH